MKLFKFLQGWTLPLIGVCGLVFALSSVMARQPEPPVVPLVAPPQSQFEQSIAGIGVVEPRGEVIAIGTELSGIVRDVFVEAGQDVQAGDPLFSLDQRQIDSEIAALEASLESAVIQSQDAAQQFAIVERIKDKRAVSEDEFDRRKFANLLGQTRMKEIDAQLAQARTTKERLITRAPSAGRILDVNVRPGEFAGAGVLAEPLIRMGDVTVLHVRVEIDEEMAINLRPESSASAIPRGSPDQKYKLLFIRREPYIRSKQNLAVAGQRVDTRVAQVVYALDPAVNNVYVGQQMDVFIHNEDPSKVVQTQ